MTSTAAQAQPHPVALFISDLHLQASLPHTTQAFFDFLTTHAAHTQALYLLGDIFEYWAGDDDLATPFNASIAAAIKAVSDSGVATYWIAGNRDFLVGETFAKAAGLTLLDDPTVITIGNTTITIAHGDAECTDDTAYMAFRNQVRNPVWQQQFLAMPLAQRKAIIEGVRQNSQAANKDKSMAIMDVNPDAIAQLFASTASQTIIHGHTHRPALHVAEDGKRRFVLPDWEYDVSPARGGWIAADADGTLHRFDAQGQEIPQA
jgi:UDP-2,3-diacylglucosamine hydrolase